MTGEEIIKDIAEQIYEDLTDDVDFEIKDPDDKDEAIRRLEYWLMKLVIRGGSPV